MPRPGLEPGSARLEGECSSIERAGRRAERESNPRARFCRPRSSQRIGSERAEGIEPTSAVWKTAVLPLNDAREKMEVESARLVTERTESTKVDGVRGGLRSEAKCTRIARVQTGHSPFELRSRGRSGRNRTFSPSFGGSAGHHDSPTCGIAPRRGIEPLSPHGQWGCDASRITRRNRKRAGGRAE